MKDIARDLGVSQMTVSKALRNHSDISEQTRERVLKRMRELNYQPDWIARSMVTRRTYLVGLVLPDLMHSFFAEVASGSRTSEVTFWAAKFATMMKNITNCRTRSSKGIRLGSCSASTWAIYHL